MHPDDAFGFLRSFLAHRAHVADGLRIVSDAVAARAHVHDLSKLSDEEFGSYCRINAGVRGGAKFGTPEYAALIDSEREHVDAHFKRNRHHPERPRLLGEAAEEERGLPDDFTYFTTVDSAAMTFIDVIEMVVDWWAARKGYADPRPWPESFELNLKAKGKYLTPHQVWLARSVAALLGGNA